MTTINALSNAIYHFPPPIVSITHEKKCLDDIKQYQMFQTFSTWNEYLIAMAYCNILKMYDDIMQENDIWENTYHIFTSFIIFCLYLLPTVILNFTCWCYSWRKRV